MKTEDAVEKTCSHVYKEQTDVSNDDSAGPMFSGWQGCEPSPSWRCSSSRKRDREYENGSRSVNAESAKALTFFYIANLISLKIS